MQKEWYGACQLVDTHGDGCDNVKSDYGNVKLPSDISDDISDSRDFEDDRNIF